MHSNCGQEYGMSSILQSTVNIEGGFKMSQRQNDDGLTTLERLAEYVQQEKLKHTLSPVVPTPVADILPHEKQQREPVGVTPVQSFDEQKECALREVGIASKMLVEMFTSKSLSSRGFGLLSEGMAHFTLPLVLLDEKQAAKAVKVDKIAYSKEYIKLVDCYRTALGKLIALGLQEEADNELKSLYDRCEHAIKERRGAVETKQPELIKKAGSRRKLRLTLKRSFFAAVSTLSLLLVIAVYLSYRDPPKRGQEIPYKMPTFEEVLKYKPAPPASSPWLK